MLQTLEKGLNGEFVFEFKDKEEREEQKILSLSKLWEQCCEELGFHVCARDRGDTAWVARPSKGEEIEKRMKTFFSQLQIYIKELEAYEFAAGSPDKALVLQKCVEELNAYCDRFVGHREYLERTPFGSSYEKMQEVLQAQSLSTLKNLSAFLLHDMEALVTASPSRYIVWSTGFYQSDRPRRASDLTNEAHVSHSFLEVISWCTWIKSLVDEVLAMRFAEDTQQHHHELKGLLQEVSSELKKLPLRVSAPKTDAADVLSDASWFQVRSEIASISESSDSSTSGISVETFGCPCFMTDSVFKAPDGSFVSSQQLVKGSKVLGFDGSILTVNNPPEQHQARATVILHAGGAKLQVTPDHRIVLATSSPVPAARLREGDMILVDEQPSRLLQIEFIPTPVTVLKIAFTPDLPVGVFQPPRTILSHGHKKIRRGWGARRQSGQDNEQCSIRTQGFLSD